MKRWVWVLFIVSGAATAQTSDEKARFLYLEAESSKEQEDFERCQRLLGEVDTLLGRQTLRVQGLRVECAYKAGAWDETVQAARAYFALQPDSRLEEYKNVGLWLVRAEERIEERRAAERALEERKAREAFWKKKQQEQKAEKERAAAEHKAENERREREQRMERWRERDLEAAQTKNHQRKRTRAAKRREAQALSELIDESKSKAKEYDESAYASCANTVVFGCLGGLSGLVACGALGGTAATLFSPSFAAEFVPPDVGAELASIVLSLVGASNLVGGVLASAVAYNFGDDFLQMKRQAGRERDRAAAWQAEYDALILGSHSE